MSDHSWQQSVIYHYLMVARIRDRLAMNKESSHNFRMERFKLKKLNEVEGERIIVLRSQIGLLHWRIWKLRLKLILSGKLLQRT
jgi:hypothetical protein